MEITLNLMMIHCERDILKGILKTQVWVNIYENEP